jgi:hypothetical protein
MRSSINKLIDGFASVVVGVEGVPDAAPLAGDWLSGGACV